MSHTNAAFAASNHFVEVLDSATGARTYRGRSISGWVGPSRRTYERAVADTARHVGIAHALGTMPRESVATEGVRLVELVTAGDAVAAADAIVAATGEDFGEVFDELLEAVS
jgi:hypothetical protein